MNTTFTGFLSTLDDKKNQNYEENKEANKPMGVYLSKLEQIYIEGQREIEKNNRAQFPCLLNNVYLYD